VADRPTVRMDTDAVSHSSPDPQLSKETRLLERSAPVFLAIPIHRRQR